MIKGYSEEDILKASEELARATGASFEYAQDNLESLYRLNKELGTKTILRWATYGESKYKPVGVKWVQWLNWLHGLLLFKLWLFIENRLEKKYHYVCSEYKGKSSDSSDYLGFSQRKRRIK